MSWGNKKKNRKEKNNFLPKTSLQTAQTCYNEAVKRKNVFVARKGAAWRGSRSGKQRKREVPERGDFNP